jgi:hypothetical protein
MKTAALIGPAAPPGVTILRDGIEYKLPADPPDDAHS